MRRALLAGSVIGLAGAMLAVAMLRRPAVGDGAWPVPGTGVYAGLTVEILNGAGIDGLARTVTTRLRREGIDVVYFGTADSLHDTTLVVVRSGDTTRGVAVRRALGVGRVVREADAGALLDVSVILGRDAATLGRDP